MKQGKIIKVTEMSEQRSNNMLKMFANKRFRVAGMIGDYVLMRMERGKKQ